MRTAISISLILLGALLIPLTQANSAPTTETVVIAPEHIYVPLGFDSNDQVEIVIEAQLPNLCYSGPTIQKEIVGNEIRLELTATRRLGPEIQCAQVVVPVAETVNLGVLNAGDYSIVVNGGDRSEMQSMVAVTDAPIAPTDNHIYANVDAIEQVPGERRFILKGYTPSDCLVLDRVDYVYNEVDTLAVLPIMRKVRESCPMKMVPFAFALDVPAAVTVEKFLIHARAMDGKSVNRIFFPNL